MSSPGSTTTGTPSTGTSTTGTARHEAGEVAATAKDAGTQVVQSAKEQVGEVTKEAGRQARDLLDQLRSEATDQAATQQERAAGGLRSLADELSGMARRSDQDGPATDLARQAAGRLQDVAQWLEQRDPGDVLDEVRAFARRRPGAYLALAAGAGLLAGRLTRGLASHDDSPPDRTGTAPSRPTRGVAAPDRYPEFPTTEDVLQQSAVAPPPVVGSGAIGLTDPPGAPFPGSAPGSLGDIPR
ncbi:hypothetical protein [Nakamurella sp.]|uniref:hypothetical protein n=1 Tax=Nakamurella sp. TaxID=1869182 RepID=UPI003B3A8CDB